MKDFCRTCGKKVNEESSRNIFSPMSRRLLQSVRNITNCWVENVTGFPIYICEDCQSLIKQIKSFRKHCTKIEAFLARRKTKLITISDNLAAETAPQNEVKTADPLGLEEQEELAELLPYDIKEEPRGETEIQKHAKEPEQMSNCNYDVQPDSDQYEDYLLDSDMQKPHTSMQQEQPQQQHQQSVEISNKLPKHIDNSKRGYRKYTMRVGKRTMYIKMTDEKQPKRIVDPQRQWSAARPCICEHCGRQFKDGSNLNVHLLRHTGTKNYECKQCHEKCYTLHLLRRHQLKHTEGPYECTFCGLQYSTNSSRVRHEREACKKGRAPQSKTEIIKRGERTFHCDVCDLWFLRAGNLAQHIKSSNHITNERRKSKKLQLKQNSF